MHTRFARLVACLVLPTLALPAAAQTCLSAPMAEMDDARPFPACASAPWGPGTVPSVRANAAGVTAWTWCPAEGGSWRLSYGAATWSWLLSTAPTTAKAWLGTAPTMTNLQGAADSAINARIDAPELQAVWCPHWQTMQASKPAPAVQYWVAKAPINAKPTGTRPTSQLTGGTLAPDYGRVAEYAACDCAAAQLLQGTSRYCSVNGSPATVAVCVAKP